MGSPWCSICLERKGREVQGAVVPCGHTFCLPCIRQWRRQNRACPVCRRAMDNVLRLYSGFEHNAEGASNATGIGERATGPHSRQRRRGRQHRVQGEVVTSQQSPSDSPAWMGRMRNAVCRLLFPLVLPIWRLDTWRSAIWRLWTAWLTVGSFCFSVCGFVLSLVVAVLRWTVRKLRIRESTIWRSLTALLKDSFHFVARPVARATTWLADKIGLPSPTRHPGWFRFGVSMFNLSLLLLPVACYYDCLDHTRRAWNQLCSRHRRILAATACLLMGVLAGDLSQPDSLLWRTVVPALKPLAWHAFLAVVFYYVVALVLFCCVKIFMVVWERCKDHA